MSVQAGPTGESPAPGADPTQQQAPNPAADPAAGVPPAAQPQAEQQPTEQPTTEQGAWPEQIAPYQQHLEALLQADEEGYRPLDGLLSFYNLVAEAGAEDANPESVEQFETWWESVGKDFGFLDDDGEPLGEQGDLPDEGDMPPWAQQLVQQNQQLQQRLEQFETQGRVGEIQTQMEQQLTKLMAENGIQEDRANTPEESWASTRILRLAVSYGDDPNAIQNAVRDYLDMTGAAQQGLINGAGQQTMSVDQLANGGAPAPSLAGGRADMEPEPVGSWGDASQAALARLRGQG